MKTILFIASLLLAVIVVNNVVPTIIHTTLTNKYYTKMYTYPWLGKLPVKPKVIILGSSTSKSISSGYIQDALNYPRGSVVNLSAIPSNPEICYFIIKSNAKYFDKDFIVVYGIDPWILTEKYYRYFAILYYKWDLQERLYFTFTKSNQSLMLRLRLLLCGNLLQEIMLTMSGVTLSQNQAIPHDYGASKQIEGKETTEPLPVYNMSEFEGNFFAEEVYELSGLFFNRLANLDNLIHQLNGRLILYHPTYSHNFTDKYARLPIRQKLETRISASIKSGTYQNVLLSSPDTLFKDFVHTSYEGRYINQDRLVKAITTMEK